MEQDDGPALVIPAALRDGVARVRGERSPGGAQEVELVRLPTCASQLVVHVTPGGEARASVAGPSTVAKYRLIVPGPFYLQLVFRADAARAVFGVAVRELTDRVVELEDLWGRRAREVIERVVARRDAPQAAADAIEGVLAARLRARTPGAALARRATDVLRGAAATTRVRRLAETLGVSERALRQAFAEHVGVSPKRFARIARVRRAADAAGTASWARVAAEHEFYDQAHLNAEFRALLQVSPGQYLAGRLPFVRPGA